MSNEYTGNKPGAESDNWTKPKKERRKKAKMGSVQYVYTVEQEERFRMTALSKAVELHVGMASFSMGVPEGGAHDVVKTSENFYNFLVNGDYLTESPTPSAPETTDEFFSEPEKSDGKDDGNENVIQVIEK